MRIDRTDRVLNAVRRRIGDQGDMHIRISRFTFRLIMKALRVGDWEDAEDFREVDAVALELLVLATIKARKAEGEGVTMGCERVTLPGGFTAIVCGPRKRKRCSCGRPANLLCDWKVEGGTCDQPVCSRCTTSPAPDKDLCPGHGAEFEAWKARKAAQRAEGGDRA